MLTIGMLGGMSWESTAEYYRLANEMVRDRLGGMHSARCLVHSVDFAEIERMQAEGRWDDAGEALARAVAVAGVETVGLLGTAFTMEQDFYIDRLAAHGLTVLVPDEEDRAVVHRVIYDELVVGVVEEASRAAYRAVMGWLVERGAEGIILGCTEIELLVGAEDATVPVFPTTRLHVQAAVEQALRD